MAAAMRSLAREFSDCLAGRLSSLCRPPWIAMRVNKPREERRTRTAMSSSMWPCTAVGVQGGQRKDHRHKGSTWLIPVSSGRTDRHRLHRGGDRLANTAIWRIALVRMHCHQPTKDYVARPTAEGKTKTEIPSCLKRYIAGEVFPLLSLSANTRDLGVPGRM